MWEKSIPLKNGVATHTPSSQPHTCIVLCTLLIQKADTVTDSPTSRIYHSDTLEVA